MGEREVTSLKNEPIFGKSGQLLVFRKLGTCYSRSQCLDIAFDTAIDMVIKSTMITQAKLFLLSFAIGIAIDFDITSSLKLQQDRGDSREVAFYVDFGIDF